MTDERQHHQIESLLGAYVLDAVDPEEAALVGGHLEGCPRCRAEVDAGRELAGWLGTSAALEGAEPPPADLWGRIGERLGATSRPPPPMPDLARPPVARTGDGATARAPRKARWVLAAVAVAAAVAIAVLGIDLSATNAQLGRAQQALGARGTRAAVEGALANPGHRLVRLDSSVGTQLAEFVVVPGGQGYLVSAAMPPLPADETYQLWALTSGRAISVGLLGDGPRQAAFTMASVTLPTELAVTVEPAGGVATPSGSPVAAGRVPAA
jgi:anti-sigma-K factor RskA